MSLQDTKIMLLQLQNDSVSCEDKNESNVWYSGVCNNVQFYNIWMLLQAVLINKIGMLQWTHMLQQTWGNTIGRRSMRVRITCLYFHWGRLFMLFMCVRFFNAFIMESSIIVFPRERLFKFFMYVTLFMPFKFKCTVYKS
jgi:hypothetical protein